MKLFPAWRAVAIAAVAGALAGALAVYARIGVSGNDAGSEVVAGMDAANRCEARAAMAKAVAGTAKGDVAALLPADPPVSLSTLAFKGPDGAPMTLADRSGKTLLVNLWATWCAPCRAEMPALDALQRERGGERFEVMAVNVDTGDDSKPNAFLEEIGIASLARYRDSTLDLFNELKRRGLALGLPVTLLIDPQGCLLANMNGPAEWSGPDALKLIDTAIGAMPPPG